VARLTAAASLADEIRAATQATGVNLTPYGAVGFVALHAAASPRRFLVWLHLGPILLPVEVPAVDLVGQLPHRHPAVAVLTKHLFQRRVEG
jgi:hypothetical protein